MFVQQFVNGLILGSIYALIALGYTMVYGIIMLINFAHGEIYMFGAFAGMILVVFYKVPFILAFLLAMAFAALVGLTVEYLAYRPLRRSSRLAALISAIGASIFLQNLALLIMGARPYSFHSPFTPAVYKTSLLTISKLELIILAISFFLMVGLTFFVQKTKIGKAMRATAQDIDTASLMGINVNQIIAITFLIGSALGAAAGVMVGIYFRTVTPTMGLMPGLKGFWLQFWRYRQNSGSHARRAFTRYRRGYGSCIYFFPVRDVAICYSYSYYSLSLPACWAALPRKKSNILIPDKSTCCCIFKKVGGKAVDKCILFADNNSRIILLWLQV